MCACVCWGAVFGVCEHSRAGRAVMPLILYQHGTNGGEATRRQGRPFLLDAPSETSNAPPFWAGPGSPSPPPPHLACQIGTHSERGCGGPGGGPGRGPGEGQAEASRLARGGRPSATQGESVGGRHRPQLPMSTHPWLEKSTAMTSAGCAGGLGHGKGALWGSLSLPWHALASLHYFFSPSHLAAAAAAADGGRGRHSPARQAEPPPIISRASPSRDRGRTGKAFM